MAQVLRNLLDDLCILVARPCPLCAPFPRPGKPFVVYHQSAGIINEYGLSIGANPLYKKGIGFVFGRFNVDKHINGDEHAY